MAKTILGLSALLLSSCAAFKARPYNRHPEKWVISQARGFSFQVQGHGNRWYRVPQSDTLLPKAGDTLYINYPGHEGESPVTLWHTSRKYKG